jgi:hypothetical protein
MQSFAKPMMNFTRPDRLVNRRTQTRRQRRKRTATVGLVIAALLTTVIAPCLPGDARAAPQDAAAGTVGWGNSPSPPRTFFGVNTNRTRRTPDLLVDWLSELGVGFARQGFSMAGINPQCLPLSRAAEWSWSGFDNRLDQYRKHDIKVVLIALQFGAPPCATGGDANPQALIDTPQRYSDYVEAITRRALSRYPGGVIAVELGNEPDSPGFWRTQGAYKHRRHSADAYFAYMAPAARAAARVRSEARQTFSILNGGYAGSAQDLQWWESLLTQPGFGSLVDGLNVHIYPWAGASAPQQAPGSNDIHMIDQEAAIARAARLGDKPFWITEIGIQAAHTCRWAGDEQRQADLLKGVFDKFTASSAPRVSGVAWFTIQDDFADRPAAAKGDCYAIQGLGLIDDQGRKRPAFFAYKDLISRSVRAAEGKPK